jgi:hypothetical protein
MDAVFTNHPIAGSLKEILPFIMTIYRENNRDFVILNDSLTLSELEQSIKMIWNSATACLKSPVIVTNSMFKYLLGSCCPDLYASLRWKREILWGKDALFYLPEPSLDSFARQLLVGMGNALCYPQGESFFTFSGNDGALRGDLIRTAEQYLKVRLYFDKGIVRIYKRQWHEELAKFYPADYKKLTEIKERFDVLSLQARLDCFEYLKTLSDSACRFYENAARLKMMTASTVSGL